MQIVQQELRLPFERINAGEAQELLGMEATRSDRQRDTHPLATRDIKAQLFDGEAECVEVANAGGDGAAIAGTSNEGAMQLRPECGVSIAQGC